MATKKQASSTSVDSTKLLFLIIGVLVSILILGAGFYLGTKHNQVTTLTPTIIPQETTVPTATAINSTPTQGTMPSLANPASGFCSQQGGTLTIQTNGSGGQYGLCTFEDNMACEEWAMFRGDCPIGGLKTTGFDNIQQNYCAWSGGSTLAVENATCTFKDGKVCDALAYYNGTCSQ